MRRLDHLPAQATSASGLWFACAVFGGIDLLAALSFSELNFTGSELTFS